MNAITELKRPPSISSSDHPMTQLMTPHSQSNSLSYSHSHTASIQSSTQQSLNNSPLAYGFGSSGLNPPLSAVAGLSPTSIPGNSLMSPESAPHTGDLQTSPSLAKAGWRASDPGSINGLGKVDETPSGFTVGLGLGSPPGSPTPSKPTVSVAEINKMVAILNPIHFSSEISPCSVELVAERWSSQCESHCRWQ